MAKEVEELTSDFRDVDISAYPDIYSLNSEKSIILWVLLIGKEQLGRKYLTPGVVERVLSDVYGIVLPRQRILAILCAAKGDVNVRRIAGRQGFSIMQQGKDLVMGANGSVILIEPHNALSAIRKIQDILRSLRGDIAICDPYVDSKTLDFVLDIPRKCGIRLLTMNIQKPAVFKRDLTAYQRQNGNLEVRVVGTRILHDRYLISDCCMYLFGQSLNGLGKKQSFVVSLGEDIRVQTLATFESLWNSAA